MLAREGAVCRGDLALGHPARPQSMKSPRAFCAPSFGVAARGVVTRARGPSPPDVSEELGYRWGHRLEWLGRLSYAPGSETITPTSYWYKGTFIGKSPRILPLRCRPPLLALSGFLFLSAGGRRHGSGAAVIVSPAPPGEGASTDVRTAALRAPVRTHSHPGGVGQTPAQPAVSEPNQVRQCTCVRGDVSRSSRPRLILG